MKGTLSIGQAAAAVGCSVRTIRYYEQAGLLPVPVRTQGNQRRFRAADLKRLAIIRNARDLGFPLAAVGNLLELAEHPDRPCDSITGLARAHLHEVDRRLRRLTELRRQLAAIVEGCPGGPMAGCRIVAALAGDVPGVEAPAAGGPMLPR